MTLDRNLLEKMAQDDIDLMMRKNQDYGMDNLLAAGTSGIAVRALDKANRAVTLSHREGPPNFESLADTFRDMRNYGMLGQLALAGKLDYSPKTIYLAGPIDLVDREVATDWRSKFAFNVFSHGFCCFDPALAYHFARNDVHFVMRMNRLAIESCDVLVANFMFGFSLGTCREVEFAKNAGKRVLAIMPSTTTTVMAAFDLEVVHSINEAITRLTGDLAIAEQDVFPPAEGRQPSQDFAAAVAGNGREIHQDTR